METTVKTAKSLHITTNIPHKLVVYVTNEVKTKSFKTTYTANITESQIATFLEINHIANRVKKIYFNNKLYQLNNNN